MGRTAGLIMLLMISSVPVCSAQTKINPNSQIDWTGVRPYIDVTSPPYNAKGNGFADDTVAIQTALNAACAQTTSVGRFAMHPAVVFPPGIYRVAQPQRPSTSPIFSISCNFLEIRGLPGGNNAQFSNPGSEIAVIAGASPNAAPVFLIQGVTNGAYDVRFKDIGVVGYNEVYWVRSSANVTFDNAPMSVTGRTGLTDNTALKITNSEEIWRINRSNANTNQGGLSTTTPTILYTNEAPLGAEAAVDAYIYTLDDVDQGGGEEIIQRVNPGNVLIQNVEFDRNFLEDSDTGFMVAANTSGSAMSIGPMSFDLNGVEPYLSVQPFFTLNDSLGSAYGITMNHVADGPTAIQVLAGHLYDYHVIGCNTICSTQVIDASGNSIGTGTSTGRYGASNRFSDSSYLAAAPTAGLASPTAANPTISDRWCASGTMFCAIGIDPTFGVLFGLGDSNAFNAGLKQTSIETVDLQFSETLPPTSFSGAATTGGLLAAATYYAEIWSTTASNCNTNASAPTYSAGVVVAGGNNAIHWSWTLPITTPSTPSGYCIQIQTSSISPGSTIFSYLYVSGVGTTSFAYTGQPQTAGQIAPANTMVSEHRFTYNTEVLGATTVGALPSPASNPGAIAHVTDSTSVATEGQTCTGGSSSHALAFSDGSVWKCF
jgi:hypothetical protein